MLIAASVLPTISAQSVCQPGWTQTPANSAWGQKCYKEFGPTAEPMGAQNAVCTDCGYSHAQCKAQCAGETATARVYCAASAAEITFAKDVGLSGWTAYTQDSSRPDYSEPAGGWAWECGSTYADIPWDPDILGHQQPDDAGDNTDVDVSCALLLNNGTFADAGCANGGADSMPWTRCALIFTHFTCPSVRPVHMTAHAPPRSSLPVRGRREGANLRLRGPKFRSQWCLERGARFTPRRVLRGRAGLGRWPRRYHRGRAVPNVPLRLCVEPRRRLQPRWCRHVLTPERLHLHRGHLRRHVRQPRHWRDGVWRKRQRLSCQCQHRDHDDHGRAAHAPGKRAARRMRLLLGPDGADHLRRGHVDDPLR